MTSRSAHRPLGRRLSTAVAVGAMAVVFAVVPACSGSRPTLGATAPTSTSTSTSPVSAVSTTTTTTTTSTTSTNSTNSTTSTSGTSTSRTSTSGSGLTPTDGPRTLGPGDLLGYIATPLAKPSVYASASTSAEQFKISAVTDAKAPTTFAIVGDASNPDASKHPGWYQVLLPTRPNGAVGWVPEASVTVTKTPLRLFVDLTKRTLRVESNGTTMMSAPIAVGTNRNPTPLGVAYVTELIENGDPNGAYGPYAYGLALHSETLTEFAGGDGRVGIHGTNQPQKIGSAVSHGCVRLSNANVKKLVDLELPLGVPVFIT